MTVSNIGMRTNLMNPIWAVGLVTLSLSMKGATGRPSDFSLSLWEAHKWKFLFNLRQQTSPLTGSYCLQCLRSDLDLWMLWLRSPAWSIPPVGSQPMAQLPQLASLHWKCHSTWSKPSSAEETNRHAWTTIHDPPTPDSKHRIKNLFITNIHNPDLKRLLYLYDSFPSYANTTHLVSVDSNRLNK